MSTIEEKRTRKPAARHKDIVTASIEERLLMMDEAVKRPTITSAEIEAHIARVFVLMDELQRSLKKEE